MGRAILTDDFPWFLKGKPFKWLMRMKQLEYLKGLVSYLIGRCSDKSGLLNCLGWCFLPLPRSAASGGVRCGGSCILGSLWNLFSKFWKVEKPGESPFHPSHPFPCASPAVKQRTNHQWRPEWMAESAPGSPPAGSVLASGQQGPPGQAAPLWLPTKQK